MTKIYEEEFDELLLSRNPNGGRPQAIGGMVFAENGIDCNGVPKPVSSIRWHLGYCRCGTKIVISQERAEYLMYQLQRKGIRAKKYHLSWRLRVIKWLMPNLVNLKT